MSYHQRSRTHGPVLLPAPVAQNTTRTKMAKTRHPQRCLVESFPIFHSDQYLTCTTEPLYWPKDKVRKKRTRSIFVKMLPSTDEADS